jgi:hypothetical protein
MFRRIGSPVRRAEWAEVLAEDPAASVFQTPAWFDLALAVTGAADASRIYELPDGRRLVLPLLRRRLPGLPTAGAYPAGYGIGGLLATGGLRPSDVRAVLTDLRASRVAAVRITANHELAPVWTAGLVPGVRTVPGSVEVLDLDGGFPEVWEHRFRSAARRGVRKAEQSGLVVERDDTGRLVPEFYDLYLRWTARRAEESGLPAGLAERLARHREPLRKFQLAATLPDGVFRLWLARSDGRPAAAIITLVSGPYAFYWRGYSDKALAGPTRANNLLQRLAIEDACVAGCRSYNMGESGGVRELERFKQGFGTTSRPAVDIRMERLPISAAQRTAGTAAGRVLDGVRRARAALPLGGSREPARAGARPGGTDPDA